MKNRTRNKTEWEKNHYNAFAWYIVKYHGCSEIKICFKLRTISLIAEFVYVRVNFHRYIDLAWMKYHWDRGLLITRKLVWSVEVDVIAYSRPLFVDVIANFSPNVYLHEQLNGWLMFNRVCLQFRSTRILVTSVYLSL